MPVAMTENWFRQSRFNIAKMGAYYTDVEHCLDIRKMFRFSNDEQTCVFEPCIGNGRAVKAVTDAETNPNIRIFGVELNDAVAKETAADPYMECVLQGDTLSEMIISNNVFTFCFGNPPYIDTDAIEEERSKGVKATRLERRFLEKVCNMLKAGGICVWVIPHRIISEYSYISYWMSNFETLAIYKFRGQEFKKFGQVVIVGRRRSQNCSFLKEMIEKMQESISLEKLEELPSSFDSEQIIDVPVSSVDSIKTFKNKKFDGQSAFQFLRDNTEFTREIQQKAGKLIEVPIYGMTDILKPPVPLKKANKALLVSCGIGSGFAGEDGKDLHLQRGCVREIEENEIEQKGSFKTVIIRTKAKVNLTIIENDGTIKELI